MYYRLILALNALVLAFTIFWNYYANAGFLTDNSVGGLSAEYFNLFTPAGYAFSIWGFIYLGLLGNMVFLLFNQKNESQIERNINQAKWLSLANFGNCFWIYFWLTEKTGLSLLTMLVILFFLMKLCTSLNFSELTFWEKWPVSLYAGWIIVATVANVSAYLAKIEWSWLLTDVQWTYFMIAISTLVYALLIRLKGWIIIAIPGVWAIIAIAVRHWEELTSLSFVAIASAIILVGLSVRQSLSISQTETQPA